MMENAWLWVYLGLLIGIIIRNIYYTYMKVSKEGKKFQWEFVLTAVVTAIISVWGVMQGEANITIPPYMAEKGWWGLLALGIIAGIGGNEILNNIMKQVKKNEPKTIDEAIKEIEKIEEKED